MSDGLFQMDFLSAWPAGIGGGVRVGLIGCCVLALCIGAAAPGREEGGRGKSSRFTYDRESI